MWFSGQIFGFGGKETCNEILSQETQVGTFLIRFSESNPGLFGVAFISDDPNDRIKHYLIKHEDTGANKTLPDFLRNKPQFKFLLQFNFEDLTLQKIEKDIAFQEYYSKQKKIEPKDNGYVLL